jgi:hypothetical protein
MSWAVSDVFDHAAIRATTELGDAIKSARTWTTLSAESTGITNLARVQGVGDGKDTVFARVVVSSDRVQTKELAFGYSDAAIVFVNDTLIYKGNNGYQTRDYRYLGTIGLFDRVALPLHAGENEIWIAVSEDFGGWGIIATIEDF